MTPRQLAMTEGRTRYFTGKPCKHGHTVERNVCGGACVECSRLQSLAAYKRDPKKAIARALAAQRKRYPEILKRASEYHAENRDRILVRMRDYGKATRKIRHAKTMEWRRANPEKVRISDDRKRAKRHQAPGTHTAKQIKALFSAQNGRCPAPCGADLANGYHRDHIEPLSRGGCNCIFNIQLLCADCNTRKSDKPAAVWFAERRIAA